MASILVAEDDAADRLRVVHALTKAGHDVHEVSGGRDALSVFSERPIKVVVTDIVMEDGDGLYLIDRLRAIKPDVTVIAVSGLGASGLEMAVAMGATASLRKPVEPDELLAAVDEATGQG